MNFPAARPGLRRHEARVGFLRIAEAINRPWFKVHTVTVERTLAWFGVKVREDRADLMQDVFFSAYLALVHGEQIENPRAWLRECARKHASNYRHKEARRKLHTGGDLAVYGKDPEQITSDRETLKTALAALTRVSPLSVGVHGV